MTPEEWEADYYAKVDREMFEKYIRELDAEEGIGLPLTPEEIANWEAIERELLEVE